MVQHGGDRRMCLGAKVIVVNESRGHKSQCGQPNDNQDTH